MNIFWDYESLTDEEKRRENRKLVEKYPFLLPRNVWSDKVIEDYDYSWTLMDDIPIGWRISFGELFLDELKEELEKFNYLNEYRAVQIKEKFGSLRWYDNGYPKDSKILEIIDKYEVLSENICINCGKPDSHMINDSWVSPYCKKCWTNIQLNVWKDRKSYNNILKDAMESYNELTHGDGIMCTELKWTTFEGKDRVDHRVNISDTVEKIRENWTKYQKHLEETYDR